MADEMKGAQLIAGERLVTWLESSMERLLLIDSRPFVEYNMSHILEAININCSKLMKRRLQQDKVLITELIQHSAKQKVEIDGKQEVVVYDQNSADLATVPSDSFLSLLLRKLEKNFNSVHLLAGRVRGGTPEQSLWKPCYLSFSWLNSSASTGFFFSFATHLNPSVHPSCLLASPFGQQDLETMFAGISDLIVA
ncbi:hypothetical protein Chor_002560 [Crotalus horridus]